MLGEFFLRSRLKPESNLTLLFAVQSDHCREISSHRKKQCDSHDELAQELWRRSSFSKNHGLGVMISSPNRTLLCVRLLHRRFCALNALIAQSENKSRL